jgi:hypothetical protein
MPAAPPAVPAIARPTVVAIDMGYGHLRPARAIATMLGSPVLHADRPPIADAEEQEHWAATRRFYETMSRVSSAPWVGRPFRAASIRSAICPAARSASD